ncbi:MAG: gliding motility protein GldN [Flavobacteriales bacterium]|nr:gliding motility protein GldN [Flavobacteriales bacterium]
MKPKLIAYPAMVLFCFVLFQHTETRAQVINPPQQSIFPPQKGSRPPVAYASIREADVMWSKKVWRRIDLRQKMNYPYYYPIDPIADRKSLFEVICIGLFSNGTLTAYDPGPLGNNDQFDILLSTEEAQAKITSYDSVEVYLIDEDETVLMPDSTLITSADVVMYEIKEEWFFDKQRSVMDVRIIGICPMVEKKDEETGEIRGLMPLFWIYFPALRLELAQYKAFNRQNGVRLTYEDMFQKRMFASYIIKEDNVYDRFINEYTAGLDALLEAERIKNEIFFFEHDVWHY